MSIKPGFYFWSPRGSDVVVIARVMINQRSHGRHARMYCTDGVGYSATTISVDELIAHGELTPVLDRWRISRGKRPV